MKNKLRRFIAMILAMAMNLSLLSANVWAAELVPKEESESEYGICDEQTVKQGFSFDADFEMEEQTEESTDGTTENEPDSVNAHETQQEITSQDEEELKGKRNNLKTMCRSRGKVIVTNCKHSP